MKIFIASDHAGLEVKNQIIEKFTQFEWTDLGTQNSASTDYSDWADQVSSKISKGEGLGLLVCGSGIGMSMRANRYPKVRAALCWDNVSARLSREHNDANILCLGARLIPIGLCYEMIETFFSTKFLGGRHEGRVKKLDAPLK